MSHRSSKLHVLSRTFASLLQGSGKSMSQIARESGISISTVSRISSGDRVPSLTMVFRLAPALGVSPTTLLESLHSQVYDKAA